MQLHALGVPAGHFTHIMFDEAGHAEEPLALCAVAGLSGPGTAVVLAGDPKQLGPVIHSHVAGWCMLRQQRWLCYSARLAADDCYGMARVTTTNGPGAGCMWCNSRMCEVTHIMHLWMLDALM
jgi:hypothetical protein